MKVSVNVFLFLLSALVARAQLPICNGQYILLTTMAQPDCNGGQGQVTLSIQNYSGIFKAKWLADGAEVTSKSLYAGTYTYKVWIPGQSGCSNIGESPTYSVDVTQPAPVQPNASVKAYPTCAPSQSLTGPDGVLEVAPSGGTVSFEYKVDWDPITGSTAFQNGTSFTSGDYERLGTGPGTYFVAVHDDKGCLGQESISMPGIPAGMTMSDIVTNPSCAGQKGGINLIINNGANLPLRYSLLNPTDVTDTIATNSLGTFTNLAEGTYKASVTDQAGCTVQKNSNIYAPSPLGISLTSKENVGCFGEQDGSISVSITGGTPNFSVHAKDLLFNTIAIDNQSIRSRDLNAKFYSGDYFVYVVDGKGCISDSIYFTIDEPVTTNMSGPLVITNTKTDACYPGIGSGEIQATSTGGYPTIQFGLWTGDKTIWRDRWRDGRVYQFSSSNQSNATGLFENLSAGTYTIGVKDQFGCQRRKLVTIGTQPEITVSQQSLTNVECNSNSTGSITVSASGGLAPLIYELLPSGTQKTTPTFTGLSAGPYQVKVIDDYGCESSPLSFDITEPDVLVATITSTRNPSCNPGSGTFWYTITGGTLNYEVLLNGAVNRTITTLSPAGYSQNVDQGTYTFQVKDENGCESILDNFTISGPPSPGAPPNNTTGLSMSVSNFQHVSCPSGTNGSIQLAIQGGWPAIGGYTIEVETVTSYVDRLGSPRTNSTPYRTTNSSFVNNLPAGTYRIRVIDSYGCSRTVQQTIVQPDPIVPDLEGARGNCGVSGNSTQANGGVTLYGISGGTPPYTYFVNGILSTDDFFPNLNLSGVNMVIYDANNCVRYYP